MGNDYAERLDKRYIDDNALSTGTIKSEKN